MSERRRPAAFKLDDVRIEESEAAAERAIESADAVIVRGADPFDTDAIDTLPAGVPASSPRRWPRALPKTKASTCAKSKAAAKTAAS